mmetsp:Transcript_9259/g.21513  ORF Transcript_9259/g.21513 Transcript_9259/m.21513 type:complete len:227 (-) Transcript_9259:525-1205(-)
MKPVNRPIVAADIPSGAMQAPSKLVHSTERHLDNLEALVFENGVQINLLGLSDDGGGREAEHVHREPLAALRGPRTRRVVGLRRVNKAPAFGTEHCGVLLKNRPLGVGEDEARAERNEGAVEMRWREVVWETHCVHTYPMWCKFPPEPLDASRIARHRELYKDVRADSHHVGRVENRLVICDAKRVIVHACVAFFCAQLPPSLVIHGVCHRGTRRGLPQHAAVAPP